MILNIIPTLQIIAIENALPVTAFLVTSNEKPAIRWFTMSDELHLCGHGTLAASAVLFKASYYPNDIIEFLSPKAGTIFYLSILPLS